MNTIQLVFILTVTITTFAVSLLTARIYSLGLHLPSQASKIVMFLGFLGPLLFVLSMLASRFIKSDLLDFFSYHINALGGIIFYLFIFGILLGFILLLGKIFNFNVSNHIGYSFLILGLGFGIGGLVQAKFIKIVSYDINLPNASDTWKNKKAVLVSDTHFGLVNHKDFSNKVVAKILEIKPDFVLHAGDFYDGPAVETKPITESWKKLADKIPVFYAPGNHEEYGDYSGFLTSVKNAGVTALVDDVVDYQGVQIVGITYRNKKQEDAADKVLKNLKIDKTKPLILINHPPTFQTSAIQIGTNLMVSGHTHRGQFWPFNYVVQAIYGKYIYGANVDETLTTITTSGVGTAGPPMRLFNTPELVIINFK